MAFLLAARRFKGTLRSICVCFTFVVAISSQKSMAQVADCNEPIASEALQIIDNATTIQKFTVSPTRDTNWLLELRKSATSSMITGENVLPREKSEAIRRFFGNPELYNGCAQAGLPILHTGLLFLSPQGQMIIAISEDWALIVLSPLAGLYATIRRHIDPDIIHILSST